jgi:hypothetical protein
MENNLHTAHSFVYMRSIAQVPFENLKLIPIELTPQAFEVFALPRAEVIQHTDRVSLLKQRVNDV